MTVPQQPGPNGPYGSNGPNIPGFGPPTDYGDHGHSGGAPTQPLPVTPHATGPGGPDWSAIGVAALTDVSSAMETVTRFWGKADPVWHKSDDAFCKKASCAQTHAVEGRFLYLTVAGPNSGAADVKDRTSIAAGHAAASAVLPRLVTLH
ncbi:hypothetical protein [Streptacidiphilus neutrinimicus]|uniref:hypothetical protein n=1 Tax=Streptacidiphilus neutrinimicus TaxID=105420 RepID=UPI0005A6185A|nr:hypothetical protein [Streptacidiphilus neutrinimicus]